MVIPNMPTCPESLKGIQHFLNIAAEHDGRDPVVSYWCRLYATQLGLKIDKSTPEAKKLLFFLLEWLEAFKAKEKDNEAITNEVAAQAYLENYALKLFSRADEQDRAGIFNKNVVKAFYTAGMLYGMLEMFGELTEEVSNNQKYAKWKAAYIHNCLKNGETPVPGPAGGDGFDEKPSNMGFAMPGGSTTNQTGNTPDLTNQGPGYPTGSTTFPSPGYPTPGSAGPDANTSFSAPDLVPDRRQEPPPTTPASTFQPINIPMEEDGTTSGVFASNGAPLTPELIAKAQKFCKFASSSLNYDDINTAVSNLQKALILLTTGKEE